MGMDFRYSVDGPHEDDERADQQSEPDYLSGFLVDPEAQQRNLRLRAIFHRDLNNRDHDMIRPIDDESDAGISDEDRRADLVDENEPDADRSRGDREGLVDEFTEASSPTASRRSANRSWRLQLTRTAWARL